MGQPSDEAGVCFVSTGIVTTFLTVPMLALMLLPTIPVGPAPYVPHVRVRHAALEPFLREAIERSATTREMVATLDASDVIVYFELMPRMPASLPGGLGFAATAGRFRYLRIALNPTNTRKQMIAMIGHELQHAVEIAAEPTIRNTRDLQKHYKRIGIAGSGDEMWDTKAAREVGRIVAREVKQSREMARERAVVDRPMEQPY
jgi:hypothetical protein